MIGHHQGRGITHNAICQAGHWIIAGRSIVGQVISKCVICQDFAVDHSPRRWLTYQRSVLCRHPISSTQARTCLAPFTSQKDCEEVWPHPHMSGTPCCPPRNCQCHGSSFFHKCTALLHQVAWHLDWAHFFKVQETNLLKLYKSSTVIPSKTSS